MEELNATSGFLSGYIGGALSMATTYPLDTIKVRLQLFPQYKGVVDCAKTMVKQEGVRSFFRGMTFPLASASMYNSLVFGSYQLFINSICQWRYNDVNVRPSISDMVLASMGAGACSVVIGSPIDLIKIRLQMQTDPIKPRFNRTKQASKTTAANRPSPASGLQSQRYSGPINCTADIYRQSGITGLYRGAFSMLIRDIPGYAIYLVPYFTLRDYFDELYNDGGVMWTLFSSAIAGGCAGVISWGGIHPLDTIKTRFQADGQGKNRKYHSFWQCTKSIYKEDGLRAFFRGITMNAVRGFPQSACLYLGVEMTNQVLKKLKS